MTREDSPDATLAEGPSRPGARFDPSKSLPRGQTLGRYLVVDVLGAGAMGVVYRAYDPDLDRSLALKLVAVDSKTSSRGHRERERLLREAQAIARVSHPNVISVFDVGTVDNAVYVAMELIDGQTLREWLAPERSAAAILEVFTAAGQGLVAAHRQGLIHRDFKPDNVMVDREGRTKVLDFGLARATGRVDDDETLEQLRTTERSGASSIDASMTEAGMVVGTPAYMSPEQHTGQAVSDKSDQFSYCVALFEALVGRRPYKGDNLATLAYSIMQGKVEMPARLPVSRKVMNVVVRGLAVDPVDRHPSMDALLQALRRASSRRQHMGALVGAAGVAVGAAAWIDAGRSSDPAPPAVCQGAAPRVAEVWTAQRRDTIAATFASSTVAHADEMWSGAAALLDDYTDAWIDARTDACQATRVRQEQSEALLDRRIACYDGQLRELDATLAALRTADRAAVLRVTDAVLALPDPSQCTDAQLLEGPAPPPDEATRTAAEALEVELANAHAQYNLGHFDTVLESARAIVERADALGYVPLRARAYELLGEALSANGDDRQAREAFDTALHASLECRDDPRAAHIAVALTFIVGNSIADEAAGRRYLATGRALIARLGGQENLAALAWTNEGALEAATGNFEAALAAHAKARAYWEQRNPAGEELARTLDNVGAALTASGKANDAIALHEQALALRTDIYGAHHPVTANSLRELGNALSTAERFEDAQGRFEQALAIQEGARGRASRQVAALLDDLGRILRQRGELDAAAARHREAYSAWEALYDGPNPALVVSRINIGYTVSAAGKFDEAFEEFRAALELAERASGPEHPHIVYTANAAASALVDLDRHDEAWTYAKRAIELDGKAQVDPTLLAESRFIGANALWKDGNVPAATKDRARALARRALEIYVAGPPQWKPQVERIQAWLDEHG